MKRIVKKTAELAKTVVWMIINPRFLFCFALGWMITNGWAYVALGVGMFYEIEWLAAVSSGYLALLWIPATPEKLITVTLAIFFLRLFFPMDTKTLGVLKDLLAATKGKMKDMKGRKAMRYDTAVIGSGYFSLGYAQSHKNTLIIEETQLVDPNFFGRLDGFDMVTRRPNAKAAAELYDALDADGVIGEGGLAVNELEPAVCRFLRGKEPDILLGTVCVGIEKERGGYRVSVCNNEGISELHCKRVIDTRIEQGNVMNILIAIKDGKEPRIEGISPAFYGDQRLLTINMGDISDINEAKSRALDIIEDSFKAVGARAVGLSYRMLGASCFEPYTDGDGIFHVDERSFGDIFTAFEKGETYK